MYVCELSPFSGSLSGYLCAVVHASLHLVLSAVAVVQLLQVLFGVWLVQHVSVKHTLTRRNKRGLGFRFLLEEDNVSPDSPATWLGPASQNAPETSLSSSVASYEILQAEH